MPDQFLASNTGLLVAFNIKRVLFYVHGRQRRKKGTVAGALFP